MNRAERTRAALQSANRTRFARAEVKREIAAMSPTDGDRRIADLIADPPDWMETAVLWEVLQWPQRRGTSAAARFWGRLGNGEAPWPHARTLGQLTPRQRERAASLLRR